MYGSILGAFGGELSRNPGNWKLITLYLLCTFVCLAIIESLLFEGES